MPRVRWLGALKLLKIPKYFAQVRVYHTLDETMIAGTEVVHCCVAYKVGKGAEVLYLASHHGSAFRDRHFKNSWLQGGQTADEDKSWRCATAPQSFEVIARDLNDVQ